VTAFCVVVCGVLVTYTSASGEHDRMEENRAIALARSLSYVAAHSSPREVNAYIEHVHETLGDGLVEAYVLSKGGVNRFGLSLGGTYLANLDPALRDADPRQIDNPRQKEIFDRTEAVAGAAERNLDALLAVDPAGLGEGARYFKIYDETERICPAGTDLDANTHRCCPTGVADDPDTETCADGTAPSIEPEEGAPRRNVNVPVVGRDGTVTGMAGVTVAELSPSPALPWVGIIVLLLAGGSLLFGVGVVRRQLPGAAYVMLAGMVALMAVTGIWLSHWEDSTYHAKVELYAAEANVWLGAATEVTDAELVDYALRNYRDARASDLAGLPFAPEAAQRDRSAPQGFVLTFLILGLALVGLHRFLVRTFRHVAKSPWAYIYVVPSMIGMLVLVFGPFFFGIALSFHERDAGRFVPVGLRHFIDILTGEKSSEVTFYWTLGMTLLWTFANVIIHVVIGLALALILNDQLLRFKKFYRVVLILPWAIPNYITALIWRGLFDTNDGAVNQMLTGVGSAFATMTPIALVALGVALAAGGSAAGVGYQRIGRWSGSLSYWKSRRRVWALLLVAGFTAGLAVVFWGFSLLGNRVGAVDWLGGSWKTAFLANLTTNCWLGFPFMMVVSLGALQSIPGELYEAADVDGATRWQKFRTITLPLLKPALFPAIILGSIWTFNMFNIIYLVSGGGPNHETEILITEAYKAFYVLGRWGYAAAYSVMIFVILLVFSWGMNRVTKATEGAFD
jgi:arabinogalactan oligomer/maltooligosaccharide transport system permease protein